jgi:hypothetical protein
MRAPRSSTANAAIRTLAVAATLVTALTAAAPRARAATDLLPDLVAPAPTGPQLAPATLGDGQTHLLLRFNGFIHNAGAGALEIRASNPVNGVMTQSFQRIYRDDSSYHDDPSRHPQLRFEDTDGHDHWHLQNAARFSLWNESGTAEFARGAKVGFCLLDVDRLEAIGPATKVYSSNSTQYCREGQPGAASVFEGISAGWQDVYNSKLPFQWVDVSGVAPGLFRLGAQVDPDNFVLESNEANNGPTLASSPVTVPGYVAAPQAVTAPAATTITLTATRYGSPGAPAFQIESGPAHGTLSAPAGAQVAYTPKAGFSGSDSFTFSARDSASAFPTHAPAATVSLTVPPDPGAGAAKKTRLLAKLRFTRHGRFLTLRARARRTGVLRVQIKRKSRRLASCTKRARNGHRFRCRMKLRRHAAPAGARAVVRLLVNGKTAAVDTHRVPRALR